MMGEIQLTESQLKELGDFVVEGMANHPRVCSVFNNEQVQWIKACHNVAQKTKSVALATTVGFLVLGLFGVIGVGVIYKIKEWSGR